jgi:hypothetical protein
MNTHYKNKMGGIEVIREIRQEAEGARKIKCHIHTYLFSHHFFIGGRRGKEREYRQSSTAEGK